MAIATESLEKSFLAAIEKFANEQREAAITEAVKDYEQRLRVAMGRAAIDLGQPMTNRCSHESWHAKYAGAYLGFATEVPFIGIFCAKCDEKLSDSSTILDGKYIPLERADD